VKRLLLCALLFASGCASRRLLVVENELLRERVGELEARVAELSKDLPNPDDYARPIDLATVDRWLTRAGYVHTYNAAGQGHVRLEFAGRNTSFSVSVQYFPSRNVLFMATSGYLRLDEAQSVESVVLLLVQVAALNYDLLVGKFQLNPETGEILLSTELYVQEGVAYATFLQALDSLCATADDRYPDLQRAIEGLGI